MCGLPDGVYASDPRMRLSAETKTEDIPLR
jgi:hypothetical protein